jgi:phosphoribosylamine--glycine ligase
VSQRVLVVGNGGREHALLWKLTQSPAVGALFCAPGNAGTRALAETIPVRATDIAGLVRAASDHRIDLVVVGPEDPLAAGLVDALMAAGIPAFGPTAAAARIESSKAFAKEVMAAAVVPTGRTVVASDLPTALTALSSFALPVVLKADGLAAGKGVVICERRDEAVRFLTAMLDDRLLGDAGQTVLIEEFLSGPEVSVLSLTDGETIRSLAPSRDHKRAYDGDAGPNTGGMGVYAPLLDLDDATLARIHDEVLIPTVREMARRGTPFRGVLFTGLILTADGPKVLEYNARFGDPETQVALPLLTNDLYPLLAAVATGRLADVPAPEIRDGAAVGVVLASGGYPGPYPTGLPIAGLDAVSDDVTVFHAGTRLEPDGRIVTAGGRVLTVVGTGPDLATARDRAYAGADTITFDRRHLRRDIALNAGYR